MPDMIHNSYMAHGYCLLWKPWLVGLHGLSDILTALAYFAIPVAIWIFVKKRKDLEMKNLAWMFVAFITLCGMTHIVGLITLWAPIYEIEGWIKGATAIVSVITAIAIFPLIPRALAIPSPSTLQAVNAQLVDEVAAHKRTLAELEAARAELEQRVEQRSSELQESQAFLKRITDIAPTMLYVYDIQEDRIDWVNRSFAMLTGYSKDDLSEMGAKGRGETLVHPDDAVVHQAHHRRRATLQAEQIAEAEYRLRSQDGSWRWMLIQEMPYQFDSDGKIKQIVCAANDITERKEQEERIRLLMREVNHRAKNLLTVVQSIARQTARTSDPQAFTDDLSKRLQGLAASQDLIIKGEWQGVSVSDLVRSQMSHLDGMEGERLFIEGEEISLSPAAAQGIGMALHELSTNALKYGAMLNDTGTVTVSWRIEQAADGPMFIMTWAEQGGPSVRQPEGEGFGRTVIERMAAHAVSGSVTLDYATDGLIWTLSAPLGNVHTEKMPSVQDPS